MDISELKDKSLDGIATYLQATMDELLEVTENTIYGVVAMQEDSMAVITQSDRHTHQLCLIITALIQHDAFSVKQAVAIGDILAEVLKDA